MLLRLRLLTLAILALFFGCFVSHAHASNHQYVGRAILLEHRETTNKTRATLDRIIRTYEWVQYQHQAVACRNTPSLYSDCSQISPGTGIPSLPWAVEPLNHSTWGYSTFTYLYSDIPFYGFSYANYTKYEPNFVNITAQAMYYYCQTNSTCAAAYNSTSGIQASLLNLIKQNSGSIKQILAKNKALTWIPPSQYANGLSLFTTFPAPSSEILGVHNGVVYAMMNYTRPQIMAMYALKSRLQGGASMYESLMNILALVSLDPYAYLNSETTYTKRAPPPLDAVGKTRSLNALRAHREDMLARLSKLRGPLRSELFEALNMQEGHSFLGATTRGSSLTPRAGCGNAQTTSTYLSEAQSAISRACTLGTVITSNPASNLLKLGSGLQTFANAPFFKTAFGAGSQMVSYSYATVQFANAFCNVLHGFAPCAPELDFWVDGDGGTAVTLLADLAGAATGNPLATAGVAIDVLCAAAPLVLKAWQAAAASCASNCNGALCKAGSIACVG